MGCEGGMQGDSEAEWLHFMSSGVSVPSATQPPEIFGAGCRADVAFIENI